jgi:hypothetical protein
VGASTNLNSVAFKDASCGWAVGDNGLILATTDGGTTWKTQNSGTHNALSSVALSADGDVYAVGMGGVILGLPAPPQMSFASGAPATWSKGPATEYLVSRDDFTGVKEVDYSTDAGVSWANAPADPDPEVTISAQGTTVLECHAIDDAGNVGPDLSETFRIDNTPPKTLALAAVKVAPRRTAVLKYRANDTYDGTPLSPQATMKIVIKKTNGAAVKTISLGKRATNQALSYRWKCTLKKGKYNFYVYATDLAGNAQSSIGHNRLTVT